MGIIQKGGKKDIVISKTILWVHVILLFSVYLIHDTVDTIVYFQKKYVFSLELVYKITVFKCYLQQAKHGSNFIFTVLSLMLLHC